MFGNSKEVEDLRQQITAQGHEMERLREMIQALEHRIAELEVSKARPKSHFTK